tara:strand:+ start:2018 stop:2287 length:270 start_codon:yes stop_codon:yes gene_type:complete
MTVNQIISQLYSMSEEDVRKVNQVAYNILHTSRKETIKDKKRRLHVGQYVTFRDGAMAGTIVKINRTKCIVAVEGLHAQWSVPITMIQV